MAAENDVVSAFWALGGRQKGSSNECRVVRKGIALDLVYYPGSSSSLAISARYEGRSTPEEHYRGGGGPRRVIRPMNIQLRREEQGDVAAKERGVAVEAQLLDPEFDREIYVNTPSTEEVVRHVLAARETREAIRTLVRMGYGVAVDNSQGEIAISISDFRAVDTSQVPIIADALADIAGHVPRVEASGERHPVNPWARFAAVTGILAAILFFVTPFAIFTGRPGYCYESDGEGTSLVCSAAGCCEPFFLGCTAGPFLGFLLAILLARFVRGTSDAHSLRVVLLITLVALVTEVALIGASFLM